MVVHESCRIKKGEIRVNGGSGYKAKPGQGVISFLDDVYTAAGIAWPRFHKMDALCKLGFMGSELMLRNTGDISGYETGIQLANRNSSLDTDVRYSDLMKASMPAPAVFVYSLPNIVAGEICIRRGIKGENAFVVSEAFNIGEQVQQVSNLFRLGVVKACIGGWVELVGEEYDALLYMVWDRGEGNIFNTEAIQKLYNS
jgi:hypothetical protein